MNNKVTIKFHCDGRYDFETREFIDLEAPDYIAESDELVEVDVNEKFVIIFSSTEIGSKIEHKETYFPVDSVKSIEVVRMRNNPLSKRVQIY